MKPIKTAIAALALVAALGLLTACGEREENATPPGTEPLTLMLDFFPNADHAGIYSAIDSGEFKRAGLEVTPQTPSDPAAPLKLLQAGRVDLAVSYEPELLLARDKGAKLVSVGALVQKPLTSIISLDPTIRTPQDLRNKRVGTAGIPYQSSYLKAILGEAGVDPATVREINVGFNLTPALLSKKVDATLGSFWNYEGIQLQQRRRRPQIIRVEQAGVPTYNELIIVARQEDLKEGGSKVRRFMRALTRGHEQLRKDPRRAVSALVRANPDLDRKLQLASVRATLPIFFPADAKKPFGFQNAGEWRAYGAWMLRNELLTKPPEAQNALTNEFLPGQGV